MKSKEKKKSHVVEGRGQERDGGGGGVKETVKEKGKEGRRKVSSGAPVFSLLNLSKNERVCSSRKASQKNKKKIKA